MPPDLDANTQDVGSSSDVHLDDPLNAFAESEPANSSDATGVTEEKDLLSVVRDVVDEGRSNSEASPAKGQEAGQETDEQAAQKEPDDEKYSDVPFNEHPRFQHLLRKAKANETDAVRYRNVQTFLDNNGLAAEEAAEALVIAGLMKTNPSEAWARMRGPVQALLQAAGEVLPPDLAQMVQAGQMAHEAALEVSRSRAQVRGIQAYQSFNEQRTVRQREIEQGQALYNAASSWEADRRAKDPNFEAKLVPIQKELAFIQMQEGKPSTTQGVEAQLRRAYEAANASFTAAQPRPVQRPSVPRPVTGGQVAGTAQPKPQSVLDIIRSQRGR